MLYGILVGISMLLPCLPLKWVAAQQRPKEIEGLWSTDAEVRQETYQRLRKNPPADMTPLIEVIRRMKHLVTPQGRTYYQFNGPEHYIIKLLGHHRVKEAIGPLVEQIGFPFCDRLEALSPAPATIVKTLANMGPVVLPFIQTKLSCTEEDGLKRMRCLAIIELVCNDSVKAYELVKEESEKLDKTPNERRNLQAALSHFHFHAQTRSYLLLPTLPYPDDYVWK